MSRAQIRSAAAGPIGGASGDGGVEYQRAVAAYAVAHGLAGLPLPGFGFDGDNAEVVAVAAQTDHPVDDLCISFVAARRAYVQAKRRLDGGPAFASAVAQWREAALKGVDLDRDRLVLVAGRLSEPMRVLASLLQRFSHDQVGQLTGTEQKQMNRLTGHLAGLTESERDSVLRCAVILELDVEETASPGAHAATALLTRVVSRPAEAPHAWDALLHAAGRRVRTRTGDGLSRWLEALAARSIALAGHLDTPAGQREVARQAVERYFADLRRRAETLDLRSMGAVLPLVPLASADAEIYVQLQPERAQDTGRLAWVAMRRGRIVVTGLPGGGKSTAMACAAAELTDIPGAPMPVLLSLRQLYGPTMTGNLRERILCSVGGNLPDHDRAFLRAAVDQRLEDGDIVLLLDSLDETYDQRGSVVADLESFLAGVHPDVGVVLATRDVAYGQASTLGWSAVRVSAPQKAQRTVTAILRSAAPVGGVHDDGDGVSADPDRDVVDHEDDFEADGRDTGGDTSWVSARARWVRAALAKNPTLAETPLLPVLLALLAAEGDPSTLPTRRARVLYDVVKAVIDRHEAGRYDVFALGQLQDSDAAAAAMSGFSTESRIILDAGGSASVEAVTAGLAAMLTEEWELSRGHARSAADKIVRFWDEHGIFVIDNSAQRIEPRVSLFCEVGDAVHATEPTRAAELPEWMQTRSGAGKIEPLVLAAGLSPDVALQLAKIAAATGDPRLAHSVVQAVVEGAALSSDDACPVARILFDDAARADKQGWASWTAALKLPITDPYDVALPALAAYPAEYRTLAQAHFRLPAATAPRGEDAPDTRTDPGTGADVANLLEVLAMPRLPGLPSREPRRQFDISDWAADRLLITTQEAIARLLIPISAQAAEVVFATLDDRPSGLRSSLLSVLAEHGHARRVGEVHERDYEKITEQWRGLSGLDRHPERIILDAIARLDGADSHADSDFDAAVAVEQLPPAFRSRMEELAAYLATLDLNDITATPMARHDELPDLLALVAVLGGFDTRLLSAQARLVRLRRAYRDGRDEHEAYFSLFDQSAARDLDRWDDVTDVERAVELLTKLFGFGPANAVLAAGALWDHRHPDLVAPRLRAFIAGVRSPEHERIAALALCSLSGEPEPAPWVTCDDPVLRRVSVECLEAFPSERRQEVIEVLVQADDGHVREAAIRAAHKWAGEAAEALLQRAATLPDPGWTCLRCRTRNEAGAPCCPAEKCRIVGPSPSGVAAKLLAEGRAERQGRQVLLDFDAS